MPHNESPGKQLWLKNAAREGNITLHPPSRNIKPNNPTQNCSDQTLLLPRSFSDDKEAGTELSAWGWLGQTLKKAFPSPDWRWVLTEREELPVWNVLEITQITGTSLFSLKSIVPAPGSAACEPLYGFFPLKDLERQSLWEELLVR